MPEIRPVSDLRNHFTSLAETVHKYDEPMFLTKNGVGDMVVMSMECYEKQMAQLELYSKLAEAISEIENGAKGEDAEKFIKGLMDD
ncbi:MAG: type II toxin-antitoxin system Phd/YefM family antitoxin [Fibrobacter sp.]|nr:type II toxin-antitoxin system Phd/YefM family antitoxin [Fibrobacter sp.]